jgi:hypothetical protein
VIGASRRPAIALAVAAAAVAGVAAFPGTAIGSTGVAVSDPMDGIVYGASVVGSTLYTGGSFTTVGDATRREAAAFRLDDGTLLGGWQPRATGGAVYAVESSPDGSLIYLGGAFNRVDGEVVTPLVAVDPVKGRLVAVGPAFDGDVRSIVASGSYLYVGGSFTHVGSETRHKLVRLFASDLSLDRSFAPKIAGNHVNAVAVAPDGTVYAGGDLARIGNRPWSLGAFGADGSLLTSFATKVRKPVLDIDASSPGVVAVGLGGHGGTAAVLDASDGATTASWFADGDVQAVQIVGNDLYFGGHFQGDKFDVLCSKLAMADLSTQAVSCPVAGLKGSQGTEVIREDSGRVAVAGDFTRVAGSPSGDVFTFDPA